MFNIDFHNIVDENIPSKTGMPKPIFKAWLYTLIQPVVELYYTFKAYRQNTLYRLSFTGQVIYLEKLLNDIFNNGAAGIYIQDGLLITKTFLFHKAEGCPKTYLFHKSEHGDKTYLFHKAEFNSLYEFIIKVPNTVYAQLLLNNNQGLNNMKALVNLYKLAGKRFTIKSY